MNTYKTGYDVYIKINENNTVNEINSSAFINDLTNWILIDENVMGDKGHHAQGNYFDKPLFDNNGCHNYIYKNKKVRETTEEEKQAELASFPAPQPTSLEQAQADIQKNESLTLLYSALLKDNQDDLLSEIEALKSQIAILKGVQ